MSNHDLEYPLLVPVASKPTYYYIEGSGQYARVVFTETDPTKLKPGEVVYGPINPGDRLNVVFRFTFV